MFTLVFIVGCGVNTKGWPQLNLPFESDQITKIAIDYNKMPYAKNKSNFQDFLEITDNNTLEDVYHKIESFPYKEKKETNINTDSYWVKIQVTLFYNDNVGTKEYVLSFYSYGVTKGYFVLDNGDIHYVPGNFANAIYERI